MKAKRETMPHIDQVEDGKRKDDDERHSRHHRRRRRFVFGTRPCPEEHRHTDRKYAKYYKNVSINL